MGWIEVHIDTDNDAFAGKNGHHEVARIFSYLAERFTAGDVPNGMRLRDVNGNRVGSVEYDDDDNDGEG